MPELAEVETVRRIMERVLVGRTITFAEFPEDPIVLCNQSSEVLREAVVGSKVELIGRKGKFWWIQFLDGPSLCGHLGMAGWIRELGAPTVRLKEHGEKPLDDANGRPRFLKMLLTTDEGKQIAFTDGRRLSRVWLEDHPLQSKSISQLGPDMYLEPYTPEKLFEVLKKRNAPIKALLLNQKLFAGVGNWVADEVLYQSRVHPKRLGSSITKAEATRMVESLAGILQTAIDCGADEHKYPKDWIFHARWGGKRGTNLLNGMQIEREQVGGRTTAWVPKLQILKPD